MTPHKSKRNTKFKLNKLNIQENFIWKGPIMNQNIFLKFQKLKFDPPKKSKLVKLFKQVKVNKYKFQRKKSVKGVENENKLFSEMWKTQILHPQK